MPLVPDWAPNIHPMFVHFPIVLVITAATVDLAHAFSSRPVWLGTAATALYVAGAAAAVATYGTGLRAGSTVFIPGMAHPVIDAHRNWALATTGYLGGFALIRLLAHVSGASRARRHRAWIVAAGVIGVVLLQQTAEHGARLVYEFGTGVIAAPGPR